MSTPCFDDLHIWIISQQSFFFAFPLLVIVVKDKNPDHVAISDGDSDSLTSILSFFKRRSNDIVSLAYFCGIEEKRDFTTDDDCYHRSFLSIADLTSVHVYHLLSEVCIKDEIID